MKVGLNTRVLLKYAVRFGAGPDSESDGNVYQANLIIGHDRIVPAIEEKILGAEEGDTFEVAIPGRHSLGTGHPVYATVSVVEVRAATAGEIAEREAKSCSSG